MIDKLTIDRIFSAANIVDIVSDFVTLKKKGVNYQACCPFHNEKTPSFVVSPSKGLYKCFGCGKGGNAVSFVMEHEGMSYVEALKYVAKKYGIEVKDTQLTEEQTQKNNDRESMMAVSSYAGDYFTEQLNSTGEGEAVGKSYFKERGFSEGTINKFSLGYCPSKGDSFTLAALSKGYKEEFLVSTGLTIVKEKGGYWDRFSGRVIFPIHSISGRVIAFGGRTLRTDKNVAKYLNSPESEIYHKGSTLYGLFQARASISKLDNCILVEGYTDVISMHQAGVENVVASSGTSLTEAQILLISRFTRNVTVIFDGDQAGIKASLRGINMLLAQGLNIKVVLLPDGDDPDSFSRKFSSSVLKAKLEELSEDFLLFKLRLLRGEASEDPVKLSAVITDMVDSIAQIPETITRTVYIKECATRMQVDENMLLSEVAKRRVMKNTGGDPEATELLRRERAITPNIPIATNLVAGSSVEQLEKEMLKYLLKYGNIDFEYKQGRDIVQINVAETIIDGLRNNNITLTNGVYQKLYQFYCECYDSSDVKERYFVNNEDPLVSMAAVDILTSDENYALSKIWERHEVVTQSEEQRLSEAVPRVVILYKCKVIEAIIATLSKELQDETLSDDMQLDLINRIAKLNDERILISKKISRLII